MNESHRGAGVASGATARVGDAQVCHLGHRAVLGGQRAIEAVVIQLPTPARNRTRGGGHSGGADDGDGSACERTRIARRHGTDGAANEEHRRRDGTASGAAARVGDAQLVKLGHRAVLGGQRAIETVVIQPPTPARNRARGGTHSGGAGNGDGSACERTRIARRHGTDGAVNEGHHRGAGTAPGAAARVGDAQEVKIGHRAVLGGQRAIETVFKQIPTPAGNRTRGTHSGAAGDGDGSACERTRIAWESG